MSRPAGKRPYRRWTTDEEQYVIKNCKRFSAEYMGLQLRRSRSAVAGKAHFLGVTFTVPKHSDATVRRCLKLREMGLTYAEISEQTGVPVTTLKEYLGGRRRKSITAPEG